VLRVAVLSKLGNPLMPTKASRARRWLKEGKAKVVRNDLEVFVIQLTGDKVIAEKAGKTYTGWCSGDTKTQASVSDSNWKRLGQFTAKKVQLLQRSTGLIVVPSTGLSNLPLLKRSI
jgi:hypothetical protein